ncbi:anaerobic glycerol-3-phosphate dehydrogenase subunit C [Neobacillus vireti]|uniref:Sn-glycerol-3-phosphate dehydrogenase subunit C n=1 Tax=Neobacillus vireti LMG 21834 TaxID=1131730 RepID=A0AB94IJP3_9BACI|nr:anaerobic glycerol-3-phosphate dehydrogenase subunit C [Neobacillus vireti]ETI67240.1 sn-glycerol-3-phosphate dehydrogenase subunit C [Neobacillus vireti LMG 21834]
MLEIILDELTFDKCLKCNACVSSCPVANTTLEFGGPKHLGPELKRLMNNQGLIDDKRIELCTLCGSCDMSCPENVHVSTLTAFAKAFHSEKSGTKFRDFVLSNAEWVGKLASAFAPVTNLAMGMKPVRKMMEMVMDIPAERQFPKYRFHNFNRVYKKKTASTERKVAYFAGCYATFNAPEVAMSFIKVMEHNGIEVVKPDQKCCGVPMFANGQMKQGLKNANHNITSFLEYTRQGYDVVLTCTSCTLAFKKEYVSFLNTEEAKELASHVYDADEYLRLLKESGELNMNFAPMNERAGYYAPCHMKAQGIGNPAMDILELIPGFKIQDVGAGCCGQCGTFGFKTEKYDVSMAIGRPMAEAVKEVDADYTVTECGMCKNQLDQLTDKTVKHPMQIVAESYERATVLD